MAGHFARPPCWVRTMERRFVCRNRPTGLRKNRGVTFIVSAQQADEAIKKMLDEGERREQQWISLVTVLLGNVHYDVIKNGCQAVGTGYPGWGVIQLICYGDLI